jgi:peroxiredoxin
MLLPGDPAPHFTAVSSVNPKFHFDTIAGRYVVLCFFASTRIDYSARLLAAVDQRAGRFNASELAFFGVTSHPQDKDRLTQTRPGNVYFFDTDLAIGKAYGVVVSDRADGGASEGTAISGETKRFGYQPPTFILDQALRVVAVVDFDGEPAGHLDEVLRVVDAMPKLLCLRPRGGRRHADVKTA